MVEETEKTAKITVEVYDMVFSKKVSDKQGYRTLMSIIPKKKDAEPYEDMKAAD